MRKRIILVLSLAFTLVLASCGEVGKTAEPSTTPDTTPSDTQVLSDVTVVAPAGAPSIALANVIIENDKVKPNTGFDATTLGTVFTKGEVDAIIAPINLGAKMYKNNGKYALAAVVTWGNLYFASAKADFKLEDLNNNTVYLFGENTINDVIVNYVLTQKGIECTKEYLANTNLTKEKVSADSNNICLVAEPALSGLKASNPAVKTISVQALYEEITATSSYPQAGCFVKVNGNKDNIDLFLTKLQDSCDRCKTDLETTAARCETLKFGTKALMTASIPNSNIKYVKATEAKAALEAIYNLKPALFGGTLMEDGFYYA